MIAFIGDSFCSDYSYERWAKTRHPFQQCRVNKISWLELVGEHFNMDIDVHGYGGRSWWYSWDKFYQKWENELDRISTIVFCHTSYNRINNSINDELILTVDHHGDNVSEESIKARSLFFKHIYDDKFQEFAQIQYASMLAETLGHIKTIHFTCFGGHDRMLNKLPGMVFTTPLMHISVGGLTGTSAQITDQLGLNDDNHLLNHLTEINNRNLAKVVVNAIENYAPGIRPLNPADFNIVNPYGFNWPDGKWAPA